MTQPIIEQESKNPELDPQCTSCLECIEGEEEDCTCPNSKRECGHHCNHSWTHDECCWCGKLW